MSVIAITGHRPDRLVDAAWVRAELSRLLRKLHPSVMYQGMAPGADLLAADVAREMGLPYVACRPWLTHVAEGVPDAEYQRILESAQDVVVVTDTAAYTGPELYHARNRYMVEQAGIVIAVWDGDETGGTAATVRYARQLHRVLYIVNPLTKRVSTEISNMLV